MSSFLSLHFLFWLDCSSGVADDDGDGDDNDDDEDDEGRKGLQQSCILKTENKHSKIIVAVFILVVFIIAILIVVVVVLTVGRNLMSLLLNTVNLLILTISLYPNGLALSLV